MKFVADVMVGKLARWLRVLGFDVAYSNVYEDDHYKEQVRQVVREFDLKEFKVFSRCLECNTLLEEVDKEAVFEKVPPYVYLTQERFAMCASCGRVYWRGTHTDEMLKRSPL